MNNEPPSRVPSGSYHNQWSVLIHYAPLERYKYYTTTRLTNAVAGSLARPKRRGAVAQTLRGMHPSLKMFGSVADKVSWYTVYNIPGPACTQPDHDGQTELSPDHIDLVLHSQTLEISTWVRTWCRMREIGMKMSEACWVDGQNIKFKVESQGTQDPSGSIKIWCCSQYIDKKWLRTQPQKTFHCPRKITHER